MDSMPYHPLPNEGRADPVDFQRRGARLANRAHAPDPLPRGAVTAAGIAST
jgi:hypothetical protein